MAVVNIAFRARGVSGQRDPDPELAFEAFFRESYEQLVRDVIFAGGNLHEAEDAAAEAMTDVYKRWNNIRVPKAYARKAAISHLIKIKKRTHREMSTAPDDASFDHEQDPGIAIWEEEQWVATLLGSLPPGQRQVLACMYDTLTTREIAQLLGKTEAAVRRRLHDARQKLASYIADTTLSDAVAPKAREEVR